MEWVCVKSWDHGPWPMNLAELTGLGVGHMGSWSLGWAFGPGVGPGVGSGAKALGPRPLGQVFGIGPRSVGFGAGPWSKTFALGKEPRLGPKTKDLSSCV